MRESERTLAEFGPKTGWPASLLGRRDDPCPDGITDQSGDVANPQAAHQLGAMGLHGLHAQPQVLSDLARRVTPGDQLQDLVLPRRKLRKRSLERITGEAADKDLHHRLGDGGAQEWGPLRPR